MAEFLDLSGLRTFWTKIKNYISNAVTANSPAASKTVTGYSADGKIEYSDIQISESQVTSLTDDLSKKANRASPIFTGTPEAPTAASGTNTKQIATTAFVQSAIDTKIATADAMLYKGTIAAAATSSTNKYGALTQPASRGWTYKVTTAGYIDGVAVEVGDMLICNKDNTSAATASNYETIKANWDFIQTNIDGAVTGPAEVTPNHIAIFDGDSGKVIKDSGFTIGKSVPSNAVFTDTTYESKPAESGGKDVSLVTTDEKYTWNNKASNDTKNTAGTTNKVTTRLFLVGAIAQASNIQTYSNVNVYIGKDNCLYSNDKKVCTEEYAASTYEPKMTAITNDEINAL